MPTSIEQEILFGTSVVIDQDFDLLDRTLKVLDCLKEGALMTMTEIATRIEIPSTSCQRLLQAMHRHHLVLRDGSYYGLGSRLFSYAFSDLMGRPLATIASPPLRKLRIQTSLCAALFVRIGSFRVAIAVEEADDVTQRFIEVGQVGVIYAGSPSKVLMAWHSKPERDSILAHVQWTKLTKNTLDSRDQFELDCQEVRSSGYAITLGEREPTAFSISVPIWQAGRVIAALGITGPITHFSTSNLQSRLNALVAVGSELSRVMDDSSPASCTQATGLASLAQGQGLDQRSRPTAKSAAQGRSSNQGMAPLSPGGGVLKSGR